MNTLEQLTQALRIQFPTGTFQVTAPVRSDGYWTLDISYQSRHILVSWMAPNHFAISSVSSRTAYGEGPDELYSTAEALSRRLTHLLSTDEQTSPALPAALSRLREDRGLTQSQLATKLGVTQATISGLEHRKDIQISTLQRTIEALGGKLHVVARFSDASYSLISGDSDASADSAEPSGSYGRLLLFPTLERRGALSKSQDISGGIIRRRNVWSPA